MVISGFSVERGCGSGVWAQKGGFIFGRGDWAMLYPKRHWSRILFGDTMVPNIE